MAAPKPAIYTITPHKFTIYDSELSDADSDPDEEWVSISTSTTAGTVPNHITLRPRPRTHNLPARLTVSASDLQRQIRALKPASSSTAPPPMSVLKTHMPTLKAIYIVNPPSLHGPMRAYLNADLHGPFCSFRYTGAAPVVVHIPSSAECYLRVCADCVRGRLVLFCDETWRADGPGVCEKHVGVVKRNEGEGVGVQAWNERKRDVELFEAVTKVVQPLRKAETEKSGVRVFDMGEIERGDRELVHREGCRCVEK